MRGEPVLQIQRGIGVGVHESLGFDSAVFDLNACTQYTSLGVRFRVIQIRACALRRVSTFGFACPSYGTRDVAPHHLASRHFQRLFWP